MKKVVILGATKGMGRAIARALAERGDNPFLLGIEREELTKSVEDLRARSPQGIVTGFAECDLEKPDTFAPSLDAAIAHLGGLDAVIVTAGLFAVQEALEADLEFTRRLTVVNYAHTVVFCEHARQRLMARGGGCLIVFSSVAGDRGRKPVVIYGSSKAGLSAYLEGLDHRYFTQGLRVVCVKPGFVKTGMTAGLKPPPFAGTPEQVAKDIITVLDRPRPVLYTPRMWGLIMAVIRRLPRAIMRKIGF